MAPSTLIHHRCHHQQTRPFQFHAATWHRLCRAASCTQRGPQALMGLTMHITRVPRSSLPPQQPGPSELTGPTALASQVHKRQSLPSEANHGADRTLSMTHTYTRPLLRKNHPSPFPQTQRNKRERRRVGEGTGRMS